MAKTSDDIERLLAMLESRQVHCPECESLDAYILFARYDVAEVCFEMDGTIVHGDQDYADDRPEFPNLLVCKNCNHRWPVPADRPFRYDYYVESEGTRLERVQREKNILALSESGEARCNRCFQQVDFVVADPEANAHGQALAALGRLQGEWRHSDTGQKKCAVKSPGGHDQWAGVSGL